MSYSCSTIIEKQVKIIMAIHHFSATIIQRDKGRSAIAAAAYRSAERLYDARQDMVHDYTQKQGVVHRQILLPKHALAYLHERENLWNLVESTEKGYCAH